MSAGSELEAGDMMVMGPDLEVLLISTMFLDYLSTLSLALSTVFYLLNLLTGGTFCGLSTYTLDANLLETGMESEELLNGGKLTVLNNFSDPYSLLSFLAGSD